MPTLQGRIVLSPARPSESTPGAALPHTINVPPRVEISSDESRLYLKVGLAGVPLEDILVEVHEGMLSIGVSQFGSRDSNSTVKSWYRGWKKEYRIPESVREEDIEASLANGLLTVSIPRSHPHRVTVQHSAKTEAENGAAQETSN